ncbi:MAG: transketolase [Deltaproteobacteria bacterium]|nr:transketolase [Deltaproteobacteria bacterium]
MEPGSRAELAHALRMLAVDAVQKANSGHPGMPMGMADIAEVLWRDHLQHNPTNPSWPNRDRFVVSNGHGSMLLYALLHLSGYALSIDDLRAFRQLGSRTPGHPEVGLTPGVETTTGPLGQGLANAVGMALAERILSQAFNRPGFEVIDHHVYVFVGDGCLMEGLSHEACSLAGTLGLGKLIAVYDDNGISIDGRTEGWFTDDTAKRFEAYGWHVVAGVDGHRPEAIDAALRMAKDERDRPTIIIAKTIIGKGSPNKSGRESSHGAPLGASEVALVRAELGWCHEAFDIPSDIRLAWDARPRGQVSESEWQGLFDAYAAAYPELALELERRWRGDLPSSWDAAKDALLRQADERAKSGEPVATRKASKIAIDALGGMLPELVGGSADLTHSNLTFGLHSKGVLKPIGKREAQRELEGGRDDRGDQHRSAGAGAGAGEAQGQGTIGNYVYFGVREFAMAAIANGLSLYGGGFIPYVGTFLVFSDYARSAIRMAALMKQRVVYVLTHDSIGLGEDGPTHQPVEHAACLRLIPNLVVWRPCDEVETACAWAAAIERRDGPSALLLTRQNLPVVAQGGADTRGIARGGYVLEGGADPRRPDVVLIATGSEVALAVEARRALEEDGVLARVVSMPSTKVFDRQGADWHDEVLPRGVPRVAIEAGVGDFWRKYVGLEGAVVSLDRFGESAPAEVLFEHFGFTVEGVVQAARRVLV